MYRIACLIMLVAILVAGVPAMPAQADDVEIPADQLKCNDFLSPLPGNYGSFNGSNFCWWATPAWNGDVVIFAHGYMDPNPLFVQKGSIPWDQITLPDPNDATKTIPLPAILLNMNYAFGITSYSKNGLAVNEGVQAVKELAGIFKQMGARNIYLVGASEGGLVTALAIEQNPKIQVAPNQSVNLFAGGVTTCGPVGDFQKQINYWGDFRVAFDYFFRGAEFMAGFQYSPVLISQVDNPPIPNTEALWRSKVLPYAIHNELIKPANIPVINNLLAVSKAPIDPKNPVSIEETILGLLDYNVKATNEARVELSKGTATWQNLLDNKFQPFNNSRRWYFGSSEDVALNKWVDNNNHRFATSPDVVSEIRSYQTTGKIKAPLVALHTTGDPIVPFWHEILYQVKIWMNGNGGKFFSIPVARYGHCAFTAKEAIFAFAVMVFKATGTLPPLTMAPQTELDVLSRQDYTDLMKLYEPKMIFVPMVGK